MAALVPVQCPQCGAKVEVDPDVTQTTCRYCGTTSWVQRPDVARPAPPPNTRVIYVPVPGFNMPAATAPLHPVTPRASGSGGCAIAGVVVATMVVLGGVVAAGVLTRAAAPPPQGDAQEGATALGVQPKAPKKEREKRDFSRSGRPLIVDANADHADDVVVWEAKTGAFLAVDGKSGKQLWETAPVAAPSRHRAFAYVAEGALVISRGVELSLVDLTKGSPLRTITLDDNAALPCRAPAGKLRLLLDSDEVATVDAKTGQATLEKKGARCDEETSDFEDRQGVVGRRYFPASFLPANVAALRCGGMRVQGTYQYDLSDPCGPKIGVSEADLAGFDPMAAIAVDAGYLLLGQKGRGRRVAMVGRVEARKVVWSSPVSSAEPAGQPEESASRVAIMNGKVGVLSSFAGADVLQTFDIATGKREKESALGSKAEFVAGLSGRWMALTDTAILAVDPASGAVTRLFE